MNKLAKAGLGMATAVGLVGGGVAIDRYALPHERGEVAVASVDVQEAIDLYNGASETCSDAVLKAAGVHFNFESVNDPNTTDDEDNAPFKKAKADGQAYVETEYKKCMDEDSKEVLNGDLAQLQQAIVDANKAPMFEPSVIQPTTTTGA